MRASTEAASQFSGVDSEQPAFSQWPKVAVALLLVATSLVYLYPFVRRGWIPHDEGTIGLNAVRLLAGELPHIGFQDYSGGMTWFYAGLFRLFGTDVSWIRYALLGGAIVAVVLWYRIARRFGGPWSAAGAALTALVWSFPNYFAGLPSWWNVIFASAAVLCLMRYAERRTYVALLAGGFWLGLACAFKQSGIYLVGGAVLSVLYVEQVLVRASDGTRAASPLPWVRVVSGLAALVGVAYVIRGRWSIEILLLLVTPISAICVVLVADSFERPRASTSTAAHRLTTALATLLLGVSVPLMLLVTPYIASEKVGALIDGALVVPQQLKMMGYYLWPSLWLSVALIPIAALVAWSARAKESPASRFVLRCAWCVPLLVVVTFRFDVAYLLTWNAIRSGASLILVAGSTWLWTARRLGDRRAEPLFVLLAVTAFFALYQYPFAAPVYFCYVAPFAIVTLFGYLTVLGGLAGALRLPILVALALFAVLAVNRGYVQDMGYQYKVPAFESELGLDRASLKVSAADAEQYRRVVALVQAHAQRRTIHAFPDCPEVYFLSGTANPTPANFDCFWPLTSEGTFRLWRSHDIRLVVINHKPQFSSLPSAEVMSEARRRFPAGERVGQFEVRWRE